METVVGLKRLITHPVMLSKQSKAGSQTGLKMAWESKERGLAWLLLWLQGGAAPWSRLTGFELLLEPEESSLISLPTCGTEGEAGVVRLESCQQSNIKNGVRLIIINHPLICLMAEMGHVSFHWIWICLSKSYGTVYKSCSLGPVREVKASLRAFCKSPALCILRGEISVLIIFSNVWNSEGDKESGLILWL